MGDNEFMVYVILFVGAIEVQQPYDPADGEGGRAAIRTSHLGIFLITQK